MDVDVNTVTIEQLDDIIEGDVRCCVLSLLLSILGFKARACRRKAITMILMNCGGCGPTRRGVCRMHLRFIKNRFAHISCNHCGLPGTWKSV